MQLGLSDKQLQLLKLTEIKTARHLSHWIHATNVSHPSSGGRRGRSTSCPAEPRELKPWDWSWSLARVGWWDHPRAHLSSQGGGLIVSHTTHSCCHPSLYMPDARLTSGKCQHETVSSTLSSLPCFSSHG